MMRSGNGRADAAAMRVEDLTVAYRGEPVLWRVSAEVRAGALTAIVGPNGAGKSTLIKAALGIVPAAAGEVRFFGEPLARARRRIAYVPQRTSVDWDFPASAFDVVLMGRYGRLGWLRRPGREDRAVARACLERVGMAELGDRQIGELSGGQQQRVFLARALAQEADLFLMDEPFTGVDAATESAIAAVLRELGAAGRSVAAVHHDLATVETRFDDVILLNRTVIASGPAATTFSVENLRRTYGGRLAVLGGGAALAAD
ncbi:MAG: metal ABC transporter ATP-binding protein [Chloroflexota bacterium]